MRRHTSLVVASFLGIVIASPALGCGSTPAASEDAGQASGSQGARDVGALTRACLASIQRARESGDARSMPDVLRKCGDVFEERACRDAYHRAADSPAGGLGPVVTACKRAYCPRLAAPRPALCGDAEIAPEQRHDAWRELFSAMLDRDVGPRNRELIDASFAALSETPSPRMPAKQAGPGRPSPTSDEPAGGGDPATPPLIVSLTSQSGDIRIELEGPNGEHGSWLLPAGGTDEQALGLFGSTFRAIGPKPVRLRQGSGVQFLDTMVVANALRSLGFTDTQVER